MTTKILIVSADLSAWNMPACIIIFSLSLSELQSKKVVFNSVINEKAQKEEDVSEPTQSEMLH